MSERVFGVEVHPLPPGEIATEVIVLTRAMTENGDIVLNIRCSDGLTTWDRIGMLTAGLDVTRQHNLANFEPDEDDADD